MQISDERVKEIRHQFEIDRDIYHCAVRYLISKKIKSAYEREMLDRALEKEKDCESCLLMEVDF